MFYNKKSCLCGTILLSTLTILLLGMATPCAALWWDELVIPRWPQGVNPEETSTQIVNPEYLKKQEAIQQAELQMHRQARLSRQFHKWTRTRLYVKSQNNSRTRKKIKALKRELRETPKYITRAPQPDKTPQE